MFMLVLVFLGLAAAAPHRGFHHDYHDHHQFSEMDLHPSFGSQLFDPNRFWSEFESEMRQLDDMMKMFHTHFPGAQSTARVVGDQYKVTIPLSGFEEKDIVVKAREGVLMVQATQKSDDASIGKNYLDVRTMPETVDVSGVWTYENEVLTITFPLKGRPTTVPSTVVRGEVEPVTEAPSDSDRDVEQTEETKNEDQDADVGVTNEYTKDNEIQTNEISKVPVEATTYAVDLKNQYEFVPVHYRK